MWTLQFDNLLKIRQVYIFQVILSGNTVRYHPYKFQDVVFSTAIVTNDKGVPCWSVIFPDRVIVFCAITPICDKQVNINSTHEIIFISIS